ncbi:hypothetical protein [uncultured Sphingomonas sp.]|uniref:DUF6894 family protein n=1 Tax=unclassified Sphingomonas TaxID=196159 RepID=UPI0025CB7ED1|nr:hypothetical protein [uncultured Sphingomonas sp.]
MLQHGCGKKFANLCCVAQPTDFSRIIRSMPSYFFRVRTPDQVVRRAECHELPDINAALAFAQRTARSMVRVPVRRGTRVLGGSLDIENEIQQPIARVMLAEMAQQIS